MRKKATLPASQDQVFSVDAIDDRFIHAIYDCHYLRADQLTRLLYKMGNLKTVKARLKRLVDNGYLYGGPQSQDSLRAKIR